MTLKEIKKLISLGEGFTLEFKKSGTSNLGKELCAFANASGGTICIGVDDKGKITGVNNHNKLKSEIQSTARAIEPAIIIDVKSFKDIIYITVPEQKFLKESGPSRGHSQWYSYRPSQGPSQGPSRLY